MSQLTSTKRLHIFLKLLQTFGEAGRQVWQIHKDNENAALAEARANDDLTVDRVVEIGHERCRQLALAIEWLKSKMREHNTMGWRRLPVNFTTFVTGKEFLNKNGTLWPAVLDEGEKINSGQYVEVVLTGAIGTAKTTLAIYSEAFQVYLLSCMAEPHKVFDLDTSSEILVVFQSMNKHLASDVDYRRFRDVIRQSPYFQKVFPADQSKESELQFPNNIIVKPISGADTGAIGQNVIGGIIDELNFMQVVESSKQTRDGGVYDQAMSNYNSIAIRRQSRFMQMGSIPGLLCLVSSRNYPGQFTDTKEAEARTNPRIYVYDKCLWDIRPERFSGEMFRVFVGDQTRKPRLLEDDEKPAKSEEHLVKRIPIEYQVQFDNDILKSLRDIAGVATQALHPFILDTDAIAEAFGKTKSILSREVCDFEQLKLEIYTKLIKNPLEPRYVHIDLAYSKDSAGVSMGYVSGFRQVNRGGYKETLPCIDMDFTLEIRPPRGGEIKFENIRKLIYALRKYVTIKWVSFDQFQSKDSMQVMSQQGFVTGYLSMDKDTLAYDTMKQAIYDRRVKTPKHPKAQAELSTLEIDVKHNKIDHPPQGSKDIADSMTGVVRGLTMRREIWNRHKIPLQQVPKSLQNAKPEPPKPSSYMDTVRASRGVAQLRPDENGN